MAVSPATTYDLAVSFAGEHRTYVEQTVRACQDLGLNVFYDRDMGHEWWGRSFIQEQRSVYGSRTRFFVPFLSAEYLAKPIPRDEFASAMMTAVKQGDGYILPVLIGNVAVPPELLHPHIHYLRAEDYPPSHLAEVLRQKVRQATAAGHQPASVRDVVQSALNLRLPKVVPDTFSVYEELRGVFDYLAEQFRSALPALRKTGFIGSVDASPDRITVHVEHRGQIAYAINIMRGGQGLGGDKITFGFGLHHSSFGNSFNAWAAPFFDRQAQQAKLKYFDLAVAGFGGSMERELTREELFKALWDRIVEELERQQF